MKNRELEVLSISDNSVAFAMREYTVIAIISNGTVGITCKLEVWEDGYYQASFIFHSLSEAYIFMTDTISKCKTVDEMIEAYRKNHRLETLKTKTKTKKD